MQVIDYAWQRPTPEAIKAAGYEGAIRYLSFEPSKNLSPGERDALWAQGLTIGLVWEATAGAPLQGFSRGQSDAREANRQADALGWPGSFVIIYAVDFDATVAQLPAIRDYYRGVKSVGLRPPGVYGPDHVLDDLAAYEPVTCYWQCAAWSGVGNGTGGSIWVPDYGRNIQLSAQACLFQFYGSNPLPVTDHNESTGSRGTDLLDLMYHPDGHVPAPIPEEDYLMKAVFTPEITGGIGWRPYEADGHRYREGYPARLDLDVDLAAGLVTAEVTLNGDAARRFLEMYPERAYAGPRIASPPADSSWARDVAKLAPGTTAKFYVVPNAYAVPINTAVPHEGANRYVGVPDLGEMPEPFWFNQPLEPYGSHEIDVDLGEIEVDGMRVDLTPEAVQAVAIASADEQHRRSAE